MLVSNEFALTLRLFIVYFAGVVDCLVASLWVIYYCGCCFVLFDVGCFDKFSFALLAIVFLIDMVGCRVWGWYKT